MPHAAYNLNAVALDLHPASAPVAPLSSFKLAVDTLDINGQTGGQAFEDGDQRASV
jgi:hypothetical protein